MLPRLKWRKNKLQYCPLKTKIEKIDRNEDRWPVFGGKELRRM